MEPTRRYRVTTGMLKMQTGIVVVSRILILIIITISVLVITATEFIIVNYRTEVIIRNVVDISAFIIPILMLFVIVVIKVEIVTVE